MASEASWMMDMPKVHDASLSGFVCKENKGGRERKSEREGRRKSGGGGRLACYLL